MPRLPKTYKDTPVLPFTSQAEWRRWLEKNHTTCNALWICYAKKSAGIPSITYSEALEEALCFGWIDGQAASLSETHYLQRYTPRRKRSLWSRINRGKAEALIASGRMQPAGLREVEAARADGRWENAYASSTTIEIPQILRHAFDSSPVAAAAFARLDSRNRYAILYRLTHAKREETRQRLVGQFVAMLEEDRTIHPPATRRKPATG
ncbi:hypothetical protein TSACC_22953 [Terrimicrobium sacchariphilum]|uniref:Bacteriocin-protection, YdeI or OmpD-Associated n=1 Tax=Terrimicrobium sacchariphilum TaxID=690879 RepID=A0A146GDC3_TERSA|nr:YdeI/OmpD-associated family protein [Terrimicrobium sacchariphilum]GAT34528.1 hypothetical protein TSACC_22953 [Terrimicrobium sacchariphilum]